MVTPDFVFVVDLVNGLVHDDPVLLVALLLLVVQHAVVVVRTLVFICAVGVAAEQVADHQVLVFVPAPVSEVALRLPLDKHLPERLVLVDPFLD